MVSKNQIKLITSLQQKKYRQQHNLFIAEGVKVIQELLQSNYELKHLYVTENIFDNIHSNKHEFVSENEIKKMSCLVTPSNCLAVFSIPDENKILPDGLIVALDTIRDPGNLGTIIRLCDWYGVKQIVCSPECVDVFNPKVVQASMGSLTRVNVSYVNLTDYLRGITSEIFGTFMNGKNVYKQNLPQEGILVLGNEANGISDTIKNLVTQKLSIPQFGDLKETESLNVAMATAIFLSEFKRNF